MRLSHLVALLEPALEAADAEAASRRFFDSLRPLGAVSCQSRLYRRPDGPLTSERHWNAGGFIVRLAPNGWVGSAGFNYICFDCNPLLGAIEERRTRYRLTDYAPPDQARFGAYWEAFSEAGIGEGLCATSYGSNRMIASVHIGMPGVDGDEPLAQAMQMASLLLTERLLEFAPQGQTRIRLSPRERDVLAFVAEGKSDWEISIILSLSQNTVRAHVDSARRKLGCANRTHAVAKLVTNGLL